MMIGFSGKDPQDRLVGVGDPGEADSLQRLRVRPHVRDTPVVDTGPAGYHHLVTALAVALGPGVQLFGVIQRPWTRTIGGVCAGMVVLQFSGKGFSRKG